MPRDQIHSSKWELTNFATISVLELQQLQELKASGTSTRVYLVLKQHCYGFKNTCFPSIARICDMLNLEGENGERVIYRALAWLESNGFIKRKSRRSKDRFTIVSKTVEKVSKKFDTPEAPENGEDQQPDKSVSKVIPQPDKSVKRRNNRSNNQLTTPNPSVPRKGNTQGREKVVERTWRTPEERRHQRKLRAVARAEKQREDQLKAKCNDPVERSRMLTSALDFIALGLTPQKLPNELHGELHGYVIEWFEGLDQRKREFLKLTQPEDLKRIYEAIK